MKVAALSTLVLASVANAHYTFDKLLVNGVKQGGDNTYIRKHTRGYMPTKGTEILAKDFVCNTAAQPAPQVAAVKPGDKIGFQQAFGANAIEHPGPTQVYMQAVTDSKTADGSGEWFKVAQSLVCKAGSPADLRSTSWCSWGENNVNFVVPATVPDGEYLVRAEHIALHGAHAGAAEFYYACAQLKVQGSKATALPEGERVKIPGVYQTADKAINFSLWGSATSYPLTPGPAVVAGGQVRGSADGKSGDVSTTVAGGASGTPTETEDNKASAVPSAVAAETSAVAAEPTQVPAGPQGSVALWQQCGGMNYSGPKTCSEGTCKEMNPWYSQCLN